MSDIILRNINKSFGNKKIFSNLSLTIEKGEFVSIMGKSGAGKTTLLNIMGMIEKADDGEVLLLQRSCRGFFSRSATKLRKTRISYLFQNYGLIENETVEKNMRLATRFKKISRSAKNKLIHSALVQVGLANYAKSKVYTLSGGEQQRVALAKIIAKSPQIILADEPTGSLDEENRDYVLSILMRLNSQGKTVVVVTHDSCVNQAAGRHIVL